MEINERAITDKFEKDMGKDCFNSLDRLIRALKTAQEEDSLEPYEKLLHRIKSKLQFSAVHDSNFRAARKYYQLLEAVDQLPAQH